MHNHHVVLYTASNFPFKKSPNSVSGSSVFRFSSIYAKKVNSRNGTSVSTSINVLNLNFANSSNSTSLLVKTEIGGPIIGDEIL
jgi:SH3-like domain-containing protein